MFEYTTTGIECTDLEPRTERALTEHMTVLSLGGNIYSVTIQSGAEYRVDTREGRCTCPDYRHRNVCCKHQRRVNFALGELPIPVDIGDVDEKLGQHVEGATSAAATDGGEVLRDRDAEQKEASYTYHVEPPEQGGARYIRCEGCGREVIPANPDRLSHPETCPNRK